MNIIRDILVDILVAIGSFTVAFGIGIIIDSLKRKIKHWRANKTKIKLFCKPHIYSIKFLWFSGEAEFKCKKCGKVKNIFIDEESFYEWFRFRKRG